MATLKKPWDLEIGMSKDRWAKKKKNTYKLVEDMVMFPSDNVKMLQCV